MKKQVIMSIFLLGIFYLFLAQAHAETKTYFPFEKYTLDNTTLNIFMEGTRSFYNEESIIVKIGTAYALLRKGQCERILDYDVCYESSALNLSNNQGKYDGVLGLVPEVHLSIEKLVPSVRITITPDKTIYYPYENAVLSVSLKNTGNVALKEGYLYLFFDQFVQQKTFTKIKREKGNLYSYHFYSLQPDEERIMNYTFGLYSDKNITLTTWLSTNDFTSEKTATTIQIKNPVTVLFTINPQTVTYGDNVTINVTFQPDSSAILEWATLTLEDMSLTSGEKQYHFQRESLNTTKSMAFVAKAYAINTTTIYLNGSYLKYAHHPFSLQRAIIVQIEKPVLLLEGPLQITAEEQANFTIRLAPLAKYFSQTSCMLHTNFTDSIETKKVNDSFFHFTITAKPLLLKENATLSASCALTTDQGHTLKVSTKRPIQLLPKIHEQFNTSLIKTVIEQNNTLSQQKPSSQSQNNTPHQTIKQTTTTTTTTTLVYEEEQGFFTRLLAFFKGLFS